MLFFSLSRLDNAGLEEGEAEAAANWCRLGGKHPAIFQSCLTNNDDTKGQHCARRCAVLSLHQDGNEIVDGGGS